MTDAVLIGHGYWGRNIARNIFANPKIHLAAVVDPNTQNLDAATQAYPGINSYANVSDVPSWALQNSMVFVCVPPQNHPEVLEDLMYRKIESVCMPKPYCLNMDDAIKYAPMVKLIDYTFLFSNAVRELPKYLDQIGNIHHVSCVRTNLGKVQDCGVTYDLLVHDLSILTHLGFQLKPLWKVAHDSFIQDTTFTALRGFDTSPTTVNIHNSWLSHLKRKTMIFTGASGTVVYDDNEPSDKIVVYDKFIANPEDPDLMQYKYGDTLIPYLPSNNPLGDMVEAYREAHLEKTTHKTVSIGMQVHGLLERLA